MNINLPIDLNTQFTTTKYSLIETNNILMGN